MTASRPPIDGGTVLITGASSGIGLELARQLAPRASSLVAVARRKERLMGLKDELSAKHPGLVVRTASYDLTDPEAVDSLSGRPGGVRSGGRAGEQRGRRARRPLRKQ